MEPRKVVVDSGKKPPSPEKVVLKSTKIGLGLIKVSAGSGIDGYESEKKP